MLLFPFFPPVSKFLMKPLQAIFLALLSYTLTVSSSELNPLSDEFIDAINRKQSLWKAGRNFDPDTKFSDLQKLVGAVRATTVGVKRIRHVKDVEIPENFDARETWDQCKSIKRIYDQSSCGSCWAVSTAGAMSDRLCIHSNNTVQVIVSSANLMSCCTACGRGCHGGTPLDGWKYWKTTGLVTGGDYGTTEGCQNYPLPGCEHHGYNGSLPACGPYIDTPECRLTCDSGTGFTYGDSLTFGKEAYMIDEDVEQIQLEILKNGPLVADFMVYADLVSYKSGVYKQTTVVTVGRHAIRMLGWGVEDGVNYWLIANSWNSEWGNNGTFKMYRGGNECGIEDMVSAGLPKV